MEVELAGLVLLILHTHSVATFFLIVRVVTSISRAMVEEAGQVGKAVREE